MRRVPTPLALFIYNSECPIARVHWPGAAATARCTHRRFFIECALPWRPLTSPSTHHKTPPARRAPGISGTRSPSLFFASRSLPPSFLLRTPIQCPNFHRVQARAPFPESARPSAGFCRMGCHKRPRHGKTLAPPSPMKYRRSVGSAPRAPNTVPEAHRVTLQSNKRHRPFSGPARGRRQTRLRHVHQLFLPQHPPLERTGRRRRPARCGINGIDLR